jgi:hypothetical protein
MVKWFLPTFYGDIRLESQDKERTMVTLHGLTPEERVAMEKLILKAEKGHLLGKPWATAAELRAVDLTSTVKEQRLLLSAPIMDVQTVLTKALRPDRKKLHAVKISGGKIEELTSATVGLIESAASEPASSETKKSNSTSSAAPSVLATTVTPPDRGCPEPDFPQADVLATEVLRTFLSPIQITDFQHHQAFVATGVETGHRYQLTSRHCRSKMASRRRVLFDLDEGRPLCVHDYAVPASEELLAIFICLQLPGRERYLRELPE